METDKVVFATTTSIAGSKVLVYHADFLDLEALTRTLYGEVRGEIVDGQRGVADVIIQRCMDTGRWPDTVREVCHQPNQFSCWWSQNDDNYKAMTRAMLDDNIFYGCLNVATLKLVALSTGTWRSEVGGANHYLNLKTLRGHVPDWWDPTKITRTIQHHTFARL